MMKRSMKDNIAIWMLACFSVIGVLFILYASFVQFGIRGPFILIAIGCVGWSINHLSNRGII